MGDGRGGQYHAIYFFRPSLPLLLSSPTALTATTLSAGRGRRRNRPGHQLSATPLRTTCGDHDVLLSVNRISHRKSSLRSGQRTLPGFLTRFLVIRVEDGHAAGAFTGKQEILRYHQAGL